jgi:cytoskeleton protein RodZ
MDETELAAGASPLSVGARLSAARLAQNIELEDIAERTRIPLRHLVMIEQSQHAQLPAPTYSAGFVKTVANMLGLDGAALVRDFRVELGEGRRYAIDTAPYEPADPSRVPPRLLAMIALVTAIVVALVYVAWRGGSGPEQTRLATTEAAPPPAVPAPMTTAPAPAPSPAPAPVAAPVIFTATDNVWLKVAEKDGPTLFMGELKPGQSYALPSSVADPRLLTGRPQALKLTVGAVTIPQLGPADRTISDVSVKGAALLERLKQPAPPKAGPAAGSATN